MAVLDIPTPDPRAREDGLRAFADAVSSRYAVLHEIGRGGMGVVYLARDRRLGRHVAIKTLLPQLASDRTLRERFVREARAAGGMSHPNIVPIHETDETDEHVWFVMAHVEGESLAARLRREGPLQPRVVAALLRDVAAALAHAHARGIVHRDIKAENILLDAGAGRALVSDFGIAQLAEAAPLTATGQMLGTVYYVSPEQVADEPVDARSDLYSLGVVAFLALSGRFPFEGELASAVLVAHVTKAPPPVATLAPGVPASLAAIVDRCLAKAPAARFPDANALIAALDDVLRRLTAPDVVVRAPSTANAAGPLLSDSEAQEVWRRAAELQVATGVHARPAVPRLRDVVRDGARRDGLAVAQVRAAAREAGIDARFVDHALAEHGLSASGLPLQASRRRRSLGAWIAGAPLAIHVERRVPGELASHAIDRVLNTVRDGTDTLGTVSERSRELRWEGSWPGHRLDVAIVPAEGSTTVRLTQHTGAAALGRTVVALASVAGVAAPSVWLLLTVLLSVPAPSWGVPLHDATIATLAAAGGVATAIAALPLGRWLVRRMHRFHEARLKTLADLLSVRVEEGAKDD